MDDIERMADNRKDAQEGNDKMEKVVYSKGLKFNFDKSNYVILGRKRERNRLKESIQEEPLMLW